MATGVEQHSAVEGCKDTGDNERNTVPAVLGLVSQYLVARCLLHSLQCARDGVCRVGPFPQVLRHLRAADTKVLVLIADTLQPQELTQRDIAFTVA